jgi:hypothetical protein
LLWSFAALACFDRRLSLHRDLTMKKLGRFALVFITVAALAALSSKAAAQSARKDRVIPEALKAWESWATWNDVDRDCPRPYSDPKKPFCYWPSRLGLQVERVAGRFDLGVTVFQETWVPLPGSEDVWPFAVNANGVPLAVVEREGYPAVRLAPGTHRIEGTYRWSDLPQRIALPKEIGILALTLDGKAVDAPTWDAEGFLWLKRDGSSEEADKDFLEAKVYAALEDGIPLWLRTEIELTVSGKSREEELGHILPEGWKLAAVESSIPVFVDETGRMKAQVRAGKWTLRADAFRIDSPKEFRYAAAAKPAVAEQLVAFRARSDFRMVEIVGSPSIDVSQTTFPEKWRDLPVYRWDTAMPFRMEERLRGMGQQKPAGLTIARELWLDENGRGLTFRDAINGQMQNIWRLDAAAGQDLGSVRSAGQGQLITRNPQNAAPGIEVRTRNINLEATGRMPRAEDLSATGWRSDADALNVTLNLPPGWRLFALFGADWVKGDWLTSWTLLDLFLLLVFSLAVFRIWGVAAALLAFLAFGLSYHEPGAPRFAWLVLLIPLALLRVVPDGWARRLLAVGKWAAILMLVLILAPFLARQVQETLYPQLERLGPQVMTDATSREFVQDEVVAGETQSENMPVQNAEPAPPAPAETDDYRSRNFALNSSVPLKGEKKLGGKEGNLFYDAKARIQTGPGVPQWSWRKVSFGWNGPVRASQQVKPVLISMTQQRALAALRVVLLLALAAILLDARRLTGSFFRTGRKATAKASVALFLAIFAGSSPARATEIPDQATLDRLRERLLEVSDAYPTAADIPSVKLTLKERRISIEAEIHAAIRTAVPLPGRLPAWSPLSVLVDEKPETALRREDGYLWVVLPAGVHRVRVEGMLAEVTEWEWTFQLKPRQIVVDAPEWTFSGVRPDGVPEQQIFFAQKQKTTTASQASYDRQDLQTIAVVDRQIELGLVWQVRTTVTRISPLGKALALRVPLLDGENVLSSNAVVRDGFLEVRLGAQEDSYTWESGLAVVDRLKLGTTGRDSWVERWNLVASPVWNVAISGLAPVFEAGATDLIPVWQPWPGESVDLAVSRPEALAGATVTVDRAVHEISLGKRQRASKLDLSLRCSLGEDFLIDLPAEADITALSHQGKSIPVRKDGNRLIVPLRPGAQSISASWKINAPLGFRAVAEQVRLPVESANIDTVIRVPNDRWVLWANGPQRGPAVRFWGIFICAIIAAIVLGRMGSSPLHFVEWLLLLIGLTQVPLPAALAVIAWFFLLSWRGQESFLKLGHKTYNTLQVVLVGVTGIALIILLVVVGAGLLGNPEMFITGNGSSRSVLRWFQARSEALLPSPGCLSISIWWYRFFMLAWALWLAASLIRWLRRGWQNFSRGGFFRKASTVTPPPSPGSR